MRTKSTIFLLLALFLPALVIAQRDSLGPSPVGNSAFNLIEEYLENTADEREFDFNTLFESLAILARYPVNLNTADRETLEDLQILTDLQIQQFIDYRNRLGKLISIYELQAVPGFNLELINAILPFVKVREDIDDVRLSLGEMITDGDNDIYLRWGRILEEKRGYTPPPEGTDASRYVGNPDQLYLRYRHVFSNRLSYGFTAEKDPGEAFFRENNTAGFDFYSAHFYLRDYNRFLKSLAIGDYSISFGQGLILHSGFGSSKSIDISSIRRNRRTVMPYTSVSEFNFLRGAAATLRIRPQLELTLLGSYNSQDGNIETLDELSLPNDPAVQFLTSLQTSGLHRTPNEIADKNSVDVLNAGASLKYRADNWHLALNSLYTQLSSPLQRTPLPYSQYLFNDDQLLNLSVDYSWVVRNLNFFGETAYSDNGQIASINGMLVGLSPQINFALLHRYFPRDYQAINPNPIAETSGARNERGIYAGIEIRPMRRWTLSAYYDLYEHPWLRFRVDAPSRGHEYRVRLTYRQKRKLRAYVELRSETKYFNAPDNETRIDFLVPQRLVQTKIQLEYNVSQSLELRNRVHFGTFDNGVSLADGFMVYQDVIFKPRSFPVSLTSRFALFDTENFNIRFYTFENNLIYNFSIPALYGQGARFYINLRYRGIRDLSVELRYAITRFRNQETIGTGLETIEGNTRSELRAQLIYSF